jgi:soluble lytic murein transglycosylase-like protein
MRARSLSVLAACAVALLELVGAAPADALNPQIAGLQVALRAYGLYTGPIDGISGPATVAAVRTFQRRARLPVDGMAGPRTRAALGPLGRPLLGVRPLRRGAFGWDVSVLQFVLARQRLYDGALDGYFDPLTERALRRYQRRLELASDGIAGPATFAALGLQRDVPIARLASRRVLYRVVAGDTLTDIAARYGTTIAALAHLNRLDPAGPLLVGTRLSVPAVEAAAPSPSLVRAALDRWAARYRVDPHLARALAWMESGYRTDVVSAAGARGVLQVLPETRAYVEQVLLGRPAPRTAEGDVQVGLAFLRHLLSEFGDAPSALAAWYQGARALREQGMFPETRLFVDDVLALTRRM